MKFGSKYLYNPVHVNGWTGTEPVKTSKNYAAIRERNVLGRKSISTLNSISGSKY